MQKCGQFSIIPARALDDIRFDKNERHLRSLLVLGTYADKNGWCFPGLKLVSERLNVSRATMSATFHDLEKWGYVLIVKQKRDDGGWSSNKYRIVHDAELPEEFDRTIPCSKTSVVSEYPIQEPHINSEHPIQSASVEIETNVPINVPIEHCAPSAPKENYQFPEKQPDSEPTLKAKRGIAKALAEFDDCGSRAGVADVSSAQAAQVAAVAEQCNAVLPMQRTRRTAKGLDKAALQIVELNIPADKQSQFFEYLCNGGGKSLRMNPQANWFLIANSLRTWQARDYPPIHSDANGKPIQTWDTIPTFKAD